MLTVEYKLLSASSETSLTKAVNEHLYLGWKLYGNPTSSISRDHSEIDERYCQAVIKE